MVRARKRSRPGYQPGNMPPRRGYTRRPEFITELSHMKVLDLLVWDFLPHHAFHNAIANQPLLEGMRFRTFKEFYKGQLKLFVVRVE